MELDFAFLAQVADLTKEDKLICVAAGFDAMVTDGMPSQVLPFAVVAKFIVLPEDLGKNHKLYIERVDPSGETVTAGEADLVTIPNKLDRSLPSGSILVANVQMGIEKPGTYQFRILLNGVVCKTIPLHLFMAAPSHEQAKEE
jgi:hypothetical protein